MTVSTGAGAPGANWRGVFAIVCTPFTPEGALDLMADFFASPDELRRRCAALLTARESRAGGGRPSP